MIKVTGMNVKVFKIEDSVFDGKHPKDINAGYERIGKAMGEVVEGEPFYIQTNRGLFHTSRVTVVNDDNTFNTLNSVYKLELCDDAATDKKPDVKTSGKTDADKSKRKPIPNRIYIHYKGGLYEVLHLAVSSIDDSDQVVYRSLHYGTYHTRPLSEWFDVKIKQEDNDGHRDILRFELYNG